MKKIIFIGSAISTFLLPMRVLAATSNNVIQINNPANTGGGGFKNIGNFIQNALIVIFAIALLAVLIMLVWGAVEWITSGGDKEAVGKARGRILNALIGLAILAIAFALAELGATFVGLNFSNLTVPAPS